MENDKNSDFYKNILDLVPEPILILEVKDLSIRYVNLEFQVQFEKSFSFFKKKN
jgi:nitrogen-specific signal transduction histidine kinase